MWQKCVGNSTIEIFRRNDDFSDIYLVRLFLACSWVGALGRAIESARCFILQSWCWDTIFVCFRVARMMDATLATVSWICWNDDTSFLCGGALCEMERSLGGTGTAAVDTTQVFKRWAGVDVPRHCKHIWCYGMFASVALAHMVNATLCSRDSNMKTVMSCLGTSKVEMTVLLLRKANLVFGVALPHKVDTLESHIFKQILQMSRFQL